MSIAKPKNSSTDEETARALVRELHAAIKDARAVLRELRAELDQFAAEAAASRSDARKALDACAEQVDAECADVLEQVSGMASSIKQNLTSILGFKTPHEVVEAIGKSVFRELSEPVTEALARKLEQDLPAVVFAALEDLAGSGGSLRGRARRALDAGIEDQLTHGYIRVTGTVPGGDGH